MKDIRKINNSLLYESVFNTRHAETRLKHCCLRIPSFLFTMFKNHRFTFLVKKRTEKEEALFFWSFLLLASNSRFLVDDPNIVRRTKVVK